MSRNVHVHVGVTRCPEKTKGVKRSLEVSLKCPQVKLFSNFLRGVLNYRSVQCICRCFEVSRGVLALSEDVQMSRNVWRFLVVSKCLDVPIKRCLEMVCREVSISVNMCLEMFGNF